MASLEKNYAKLTKEVDDFLISLTFDRLSTLKPGDIYAMLYTNLSKLAVKYFDSLDTTHNMEISIRKDFEEGFIEITGYIKVEGKFVGIDIRYNANKRRDDFKWLG